MLSFLNGKLKFKNSRIANAFFSTNDNTTKPLKGIRVIECGHLIAGPFAGTILAYFGAEVIKIEPPTGDQVRDYRILDKEYGTSLWWYSLGRNKKSVSIDMKQAQGRDLIKKLIDTSDILIENFKPGRMEKWGLGPKVFEETNPSLIYTRVSGYGQTGPYSNKPGFASVCEAMGGFRYVNGFPEGPSVRPNLSLGDTVAGLHAALGITIALLGRKNNNEKGQVVDVSIYESIFNLLEGVVPEYSFNQSIREPSGTTITGIVPSNTYSTKDKKGIIIGGNTDSLFVKLMIVIGHPEMAENPKYSTNAGRVAYQKEIDDCINNWTQTQTCETIMSIMNDNAIPVGKIYSVEDMFQDEHYNARNLFESVETKNGREIKIPAIVPKLNDTPGSTEWAGRSIGQDTEDVLRDILHVSSPDIDVFLNDKVIFSNCKK